MNRPKLLFYMCLIWRRNNIHHGITSRGLTDQKSGRLQGPAGENRPIGRLVLQHQSLALCREVNGMITDDIARSQHREANFADFALSGAAGGHSHLAKRLSPTLSRSTA